MTIHEAKITSKGQVTLPVSLRKAMRLSTGDTIVFVEGSDGSVEVRPKSRWLSSLVGIVKSGPKVTSRDVARFLEEARGGRAAEQMARLRPNSRRRDDRS